MFTLFRNRKELQRLARQPVSENYHQRIKYLANVDMPIDFLLAGELAQIQTFGIPSISRILHNTRLYERQGTKRLDDTRAILTECMTDTVHSERGQAMVERLNFIHSHYDIRNEDYLYTLALFMVEPVRWCRTFGYRPLTEAEKQALYLEFRDLGRAMNIDNIPGDYAAMERWYQSYRAEHLACDPANGAVTEGLIEGMVGMFPRRLQPLLRPLLRRAVLVLINDDALLQVLGIKPPARTTRWLIFAMMKMRAASMKYLNIWQLRPFEGSFIQRYYASYPGGYQTQCLGPEKIIRRFQSSVATTEAQPVAEDSVAEAVAARCPAGHGHTSS